MGDQFLVEKHIIAYSYRNMSNCSNIMFKPVLFFKDFCLILTRVEGPVAHDVYSNFFERWNKQAARYGHLNPVDRRIIDVGKLCVCVCVCVCV